MKSRRIVIDIEGSVMLARQVLRDATDIVRSEVCERLDGTIRFWRRKRDLKSPKGRDVQLKKMAHFYVDALQTFRSQLVGGLLSSESKGPVERWKVSRSRRVA